MCDETRFVFINLPGREVTSVSYLTDERESFEHKSFLYIGDSKRNSFRIVFIK